MASRGGDEDYSRRVVSDREPRLPLQGQLDLTYRCNNRCRHCWLRLPEDAPEAGRELGFEEIRRIWGEARALGCRRWSISGGEPLLRPDFFEIFDLLTRSSTAYSLNTNGSLITPETARLLRRKGTKMIALYGSTPEVYAAVTGRPEGFAEVMRGFAYLREAGAGFIVQLIPMRANWHQWKEMVALAESLSPVWRVGAAWLYLSACGSPARNREIAAQRLAPSDVIALDEPPLSEEAEPGGSAPAERGPGDDRLFARCIAGRRDFHIDPYGKMSWCGFVKDPALRFDLRRGTFREGWEDFIPACAESVRGGPEWREHCGSCARRADCRWCGVYAYLETGRYSAPIPYLCSVSAESRAFKAAERARRRRFFRVAGITVGVEAQDGFGPAGFKKELMAFAADGPGDDTVIFRHRFGLPDLSGRDLGTEIYRKPPWAISRRKGQWIYQGISPARGDDSLHRIAVFNAGHTRGTIYSPPAEAARVRESGWNSLSLFPTDQIWLGPLLADRNAVLLHSAAAVVNGRGFVFVGHSEAGKSTTMELLKKAAAAGTAAGRPLAAEILCDDRNVVRRWEEGWRVHGTWSHGTTADVSPASAPLRAILFLKRSPRNGITPLTDRKRIWTLLLATLIRPLVTAEWWRKEMDVLERLVAEAEFGLMDFDKSGGIVEELARMTAPETDHE